MPRSLPVRPSELQTAPLFASLAPTQLLLLSGLMQRESFGPGATLLSLGEPAPRVYLLQSGTVKVCLLRPEPDSSLPETPFFPPSGNASRAEPAQELAREPAKTQASPQPSSQASAQASAEASPRSRGRKRKEEQQQGEEQQGERQQDEERIEEGRTAVLNLCGPGEVLGEMSALEERGSSAGVVALEPCRALWLESALFRECVEQMPALALALLANTQQRLRFATRQLYSHAAHDATGRLAAQLLLFAERYGRERPEGGVLIPLRLLQRDLADMTASSRTRINMAVSELRAAGCLEQTGSGSLVLLDRERLSGYCR